MDKPPMKIDEILDDVVLLVLDGHDPLKELGIEKNKIYVKVVGYDEYGLWVEHPSFKVPIIKKGKSTREKKSDRFYVNSLGIYSFCGSLPRCRRI